MSKKLLAEKDKKIRELYDLLRWKNGQITHYCPIVSSKEIKKALIQRCNKLGITPYEVCIKAELKWQTFRKNYIQKDQPMSTPALRSTDLRRFAKIIGVDIRINVVMDKVENVDIEKIKLERIRVNDTHK